MINESNLMTISLLLANTVLFFITNSNPTLFDACKHYPYYEKQDRSYYRWISSGFLHANFLHLFLNMFVLYQFGSTIESIYKSQLGFMEGGILFLGVYFLVLLLSAIPTFIKFKNNPHYASVGASGVISGILFIYILYYPLNLLYLFAMVPIPAVLFGFLYLLYSRWAAHSSQDHIDHDAHYYGAVIGLGTGLVIKFLI